jgi:hypothetical protein
MRLLPPRPDLPGLASGAAAGQRKQSSLEAQNLETS